MGGRQKEEEEGKDEKDGKEERKMAIVKHHATKTKQTRGRSM